MIQRTDNLQPNPDNGNGPSPASIANTGAVSAGIDLGALRLSQDFVAAAGVRKVVTTVPIKKPRKDVFVRTHQDPSYQMVVAMVEDKENGDRYAVHPSMMDAIGVDAVTTILQATIDRGGNVFLWPLRQPDETRRSDSWATSAMTACAHAQKTWVRVTPNMSAGSYDLFEATGNIPEPEWPDIAPDDLFEKALNGRVIDSMDHPLARKLQGAM